MTPDGPSLPWTEDQWALVQRTAADAARRARVASTALPVVGPLPEGQASVPALTMTEGAAREDWWRTSDERLEIDDSLTLRLTTISCEVFVRTQQAHDPDLSSVLQMVNRAAVVLGRLEDAIVLLGQPGPDQAPSLGSELAVMPPIYRVSGGDTYRGLLQASRPDPPTPEQPVPDPDTVPIPVTEGAEVGSALVTAIVAAVDRLEGRGQYGPFAAFLGHDLYEAAHRPSPGSLVLPSDRFVPFLAGGPLLRSSLLPPKEGVVVATAGAPIDIVVASDIHVGYVQRTLEPRYVLRISERLVLRIKQRRAVVGLVAKPSGTATQPTTP